jgi:hypothetical protein
MFECKAQAERVGGSDVNKFVGVLEGDRDRFLVDTLEEPIRYTEGKNVGIKRLLLQRVVPSVVRVFDVVESLVVGGLNGERSDRGPVNCSWKARGLGHVERRELGTFPGARTRSGATMQQEPTRGDRNEHRRQTGWGNRRDG